MMMVKHGSDERFLDSEVLNSKLADFCIGENICSECGIIKGLEPCSYRDKTLIVICEF
jgi:hypothetical protein